MMQEKFQITVPGKDNGAEPWASAESARNDHGQQRWVPDNSDSEDPRKFNITPPGMEIDNQPSAEINPMPLSLAGRTDVSDTSTPAGLSEGFVRLDMKGTDDLYTGEHVDMWYGDTGGFCERNNYLDRG